MKPKHILIGIIALIGIGFFTYAIFRAIHYSNIVSPDSMPNFLNWSIVVLGGALATNLGAVLGIKFEKGKSFKLRSVRFSTEPKLVFQMIFAFFYVIVMLVTMIYWGKLEWIDDPAKIVDALPLLSKTLIGVIIGTITVLTR